MEFYLASYASRVSHASDSIGHENQTKKIQSLRIPGRRQRRRLTVKHGGRVGQPRTPSFHM
jgi:hypothetical protein